MKKSECQLNSVYDLRVRGEVPLSIAFEIFLLARIFFFKCSSKPSLVEHIFIEVRVLQPVTLEIVLIFVRLHK